MRRKVTAVLLSFLVSSALFAAEDVSKTQTEIEAKKTEMTPEEKYDASSQEYDDNQFAVRGNILGWALAGGYVLDADYKVSDKMTVGLTAGLYGPSLLTYLASSLIEASLEGDGVEVDIDVGGYQLGIQGAYHLTGSALDDGLILNPYVYYSTVTAGADLKDPSNVLNTGDVEVTLDGVHTGMRGVYQVVADSGLLFQFGINLGYRVSGDAEFGGSLWDSATQSSTFADSETREEVNDIIDQYSDSRFSFGFDISVGYAF